MTAGRRPSRPLFSLLFSLLIPALTQAAPAGPASPASHVHGQVRLRVAIDGPTIVIGMSSPLDNLLGFERAPRDENEQKAVDGLVAQLRAADKLFAIDPVANCKLGPVTLHSAVLGLDSGPGAAGDASAASPGEGHADLEGSFAFNCTNAIAAKYIELGLFDAFKDMRQIEAQISAPQGQFKRSLKRPATRLGWAG
jgi:hypothetical protein